MEQLQSEVASRDRLVEDLRREVEAEKAAAAEREQQLEANWAQRERQAQAEVAFKVQELKHRLGDIEMLKEELNKVCEGDGGLLGVGLGVGLGIMCECG